MAKVGTLEIGITTKGLSEIIECISDGVERGECSPQFAKVLVCEVTSGIGKQRTIERQIKEANEYRRTLEKSLQIMMSAKQDMRYEV